MRAIDAFRLTYVDFAEHSDPILTDGSVVLSKRVFECKVKEDVALGENYHIHFRVEYRTFADKAYLTVYDPRKTTVGAHRFGRIFFMFEVEERIDGWRAIKFSTENGSMNEVPKISEPCSRIFTLVDQRIKNYIELPEDESLLIGGPQIDTDPVHALA